MKKTARRKRLSAADWRAVLRRFKASGLSVRAFCEREGLGPASFYHWRSRLCGRGPRAEPAAGASEAGPAAGFVDLGSLSAKEPRFELRLDLGAGVLLHLVRS